MTHRSPRGSPYPPAPTSAPGQVIEIAHGIVFSTLARLAGADVTIFPNTGGRFSFTANECLEICDLAVSPLGDLSENAKNMVAKVAS